MGIVEKGTAEVGRVASNLLVRMPLNWRISVMRAGNVALTQLMKTQAFKKFYLAQNKKHRAQVKEAEVDGILTTVPEGKGQKVSLFYSGGADSTYSAVLLAEEFEQVHLLTFAHQGIANTHKPQINVDRLQNRFGKDRIIHHLVDGDELWQRLYVENYDQDLKKYGGFVNTGACECCYLSWNAIAVVYNKRHGITNLAVGIDRDHSGFMYSASDAGIEVMRQFHADYGVHFFMPVYDVAEPDVKLYEMGITGERHTKRPYQFYTTSTTQGTCEFGLGHRLFAQHTVVNHPPERRQAVAKAYFGDKLQICREYAAEAIEQDLAIAFAS